MARFPTREDCVLPDLLAAHAAATPDKVFAVFEDGVEWTYAETAEHAWRAGNGLRRLGLEQREPIVAWLPNGKDALVAWFGAAALGSSTRRSTPRSTGRAARGGARTSSGRGC